MPASTGRLGQALLFLFGLGAATTGLALSKWSVRLVPGPWILVLGLAVALFVVRRRGGLVAAPELPLGIAAGSAIATYVLIPTLGLMATAGAGAVLTLATLAFLARTPTELALDAPPPALAVISGFLSLAYAVTGARVFAVVATDSIYLDGSYLLVFALGIAIGTRFRSPLAPIGAGLAMLLTLGLWDSLSPLFAHAGTLAPSFALWELVRLFAGAILVGLPAIALGAVVRRWPLTWAGAMVGALAGGFVPIGAAPYVLAICGLGEVAIGCLALERRKRELSGALGGVALVLVLVGVRWHEAALKSGASLYFTETSHNADDEAERALGAVFPLLYGDEGALEAQWLPLHHISALDIARTIATLRARYEHVQLWRTGRNAVLLGSHAPLVADANRLAHFPDRASLAAAHLDHVYAAFGHYEMDTVALDRLVAEVAAAEHGPRLISTKDNVLLECSLPRGRALTMSLGDNLELLRHQVEPDLRPLVRGLDDDTEKRLLIAYAARERGFFRTAMVALEPIRRSLEGGPHDKLLQATKEREIFWP